MRILKNVESPMRDGIKLFCNVYLPDEEGKYPAVVLRTPYIKERAVTDDLYANYEEMTKAGYAMVFQDARGTGMSEGILDATGASEINDGYDTIQWIASQPWCNGRVGTHGLSYFGYDQMAAAENNPPNLYAMCPFQNGAVLPFSMTHSGTYDQYHLAWIMERAKENLEHWVSDPEKREQVSAQLDNYLSRWNEIMFRLPAIDTPCARIEGLPQLGAYLELINGIEDDSFMKRAHRPVNIKNIKAPMLFLTGWFDGAKEGTIDNWLCATDHGMATSHRRLVIGPWLHGGKLGVSIEDQDFGEENSGVSRNIQGLEKKWYDCFMKGDTSALNDVPLVEYYVLNANVWRTSQCWPPRNITEEHYYLHSSDGNRFGLLQNEAPDNEPSQTFTYNPEHPLKSGYTDDCGRHIFADHRREQQEREDLLVYQSEPFTEEKEIAGKVSVNLFISTDVPDTDFVARLYDVREDGRPIPLLSGITRGRFRNGKGSAPFVTGQVYPIRIDLGDIAVLLPKGHRLMLDVSSSLYPASDRNLNTLDRIGYGSHSVKAQNTVWHSGEFASEIILPVIN